MKGFGRRQQIGPDGERERFRGTEPVAYEAGFFGRVTRILHPGKRLACLGGCGQIVVRELGECRKCRRRRIHAGLKRVRGRGRVLDQRRRHARGGQMSEISIAAGKSEAERRYFGGKGNRKHVFFRFLDRLIIFATSLWTRMARRSAQLASKNGLKSGQIYQK